MMNRLAFLFFAGGLALSPAFAQEHQHGEKREEQQAPVKKDAVPTKSGTTKCCEGTDKTGEMKGDMKAKMEKMKGMKERMAEKMKAAGVEGSKSKDAQSAEKKSESNKDAHGH